MTKYTFMACMLAAGALSLGSCSEDGPARITSGHGMLAANVALDGSVKAPRQSRAEESRAEVPSANDLSLRLVSTDGGTTSMEWATLAEFDSQTEFKVGNYRLEAWYGTDGEGFECPYYYGSCAVAIEDRKTTTVALTASLAQALVDVTYTERFDHYMSEYSAKVNGMDYAAGETRPIYVAPGTVSVTVDFTKPNGLKGENYEAARFTANARTHYHVTIDLDGEAGDAQLIVTYDDEMDTQEVIIDISDLVMNAPAPVIATEGFESGYAVDFVSGMAPTDPMKVNIIAQGGLKEVTLTTTGSSLLAQGWPAEINLLEATPDQKGALQSLGFSALGLWNNPDKMAVLDFTGVARHIAYVEGGDNATTFTLTVKDKNSKLAEAPVTATLNCEKLVLEITGAETMQTEEPVTITVAYNGSDLAENVTFWASNDRGTFDRIADVIVSEPMTRATADYTVTFPSLPRTKAIQIKAQCNGQQSNTVTVQPAPFEVAVNDNDVYARHALVTVNGIGADAPDQASLLAGAEYLLSTDGVNYATVTGTADGAYTDLALEPATTYYIKVSYNGLKSLVKTFTTEAAAQLPNSGMDEWSSEKKGDYQYLWTIGGGVWNTLNALTTSTNGSGSGNGLSTGGCAYKATSGTIPANSRSTKSTAYGGLFGTSKSSDGNTEGNANLHSDKHHTPTNAALIRTVGWGSGNTAKATGNTNAGFGTCNNTTAGELFLGTVDGTTPNYGIVFNSRPSSLSFYYHYDVVTSGNGDYGYAEIKMFDASGNVIASGTQNLTEQATYTQVNIPLTYTSTTKAASMSIIFRSSANAEALDKDTKYWTTPGAKNVSGGEYIGSELYIDDITLNY